MSGINLNFYPLNNIMKLNKSIPEEEVKNEIFRISEEQRNE